MMQAPLPRPWKEQFALAAAMREEDILHREKLARLAAHQRLKTAELELDAKRKDAETQAIVEAILAPPARVAAFRVELDRYDTGTVEALMDNREALDRVRERLDDMLGRAHVLPDGRRVFKTMDGERVFDEHGQALQPETIDPSSIDDRKPRWETFKADVHERVRLTEERQGLLDYQTRLDDVRDRLDKGDLTSKQLDDLQRDVRNGMPDAVRRKAGLDASDRSLGVELVSLPDSMDAMMRQTCLGPSQQSGPCL